MNMFCKGRWDINRKRSIPMPFIISIDLSDYLIQSSDIAKAEPLCFIPKKLHISEETSGTIYDVTGSFWGEIDKSLFQQLKELILSENLLDAPRN